MNLIQALTRSKEEGGTKFSREKPGPNGFIGWIAYDTPEWVYHLTFEDLTADDWELTAGQVARITKGRWQLA